MSLNRRKMPYTLKDNQLNLWFDLEVGKIDKRTGFILCHIPGKYSTIRDCDVYVAAFAKYVSIGELSISKEDLSDIDQHRRRCGALLWDYARKRQEIGAISESEVTRRLVRRKGAPTANKRTQVRKKKN
uniref:Uncharacterized protein n=1 Tax=Nicotiana tabacum TaxID=4097 RepID=A0A1S3XNI9_TOBAC|nr:PREDICTED: uncharacterized protein LOC107767035 [Nicotiana tabacum]